MQAEVERRWPWATVQFLKPSEWKKLAGLKGNANKGDVYRAALDLQSRFDHDDPVKYALDLSFQDAADALLIAVAGRRRNAENWSAGVERGEAA